jgi:hypothetical protein
MQYQYTQADEVNVSIGMTPHDMTRLIKILEDYTGDECKWFASTTANILREAIQKTATAMISEGEYIKGKTNV